MTELYTIDMFNAFGTELSFVGFSEDRINNIIMNSLFNMFFQTLGASSVFLTLEAGWLDNLKLK